MQREFSALLRVVMFFSFGTINENRSKWRLVQRSQNPSTYTKLSCFLPWVAAQYGLKYAEDGDIDPACYEAQGDPQDKDQRPCTITPSIISDLTTGEAKCIFPFYYEGKKYNECVLFDEAGFVYPVFRCPTRDITTKIDGINSFESIELTGELCPSDPTDSTSALDPTIQDCDNFSRDRAFKQCKNNCPGVRAFGIVGGGVALGVVAATSGLSIVAPAALGVMGLVGAAGIAGVGGNMLLQATCRAPLCRAQSGQCCRLQGLGTDIRCPSRC